MKKIDLFDPKIVLLISKLSDDILYLIDNQEDFTRSDLQGAVEAVVMNTLNSGLNLE
ncbi:MAG: hypothetical protein WD992_00865 [Candidatus Levyibacteriota bacterium]